MAKTVTLGPWPRLRQLSREPRDYVLLTLPAEFAAQAPERPRLPAALFVLLGMVLLSATGLLPMVACALLAAVAMVLLRCVPLGDVYTSLSWSSIVLVAGHRSVHQPGGVIPAHIPTVIRRHEKNIRWA